ncbi:uncharacterized protein MEPE_04546 [Melanopsichium pennsylvanicum]|uniref:Uncharacterized protein n=1 Tax=Melanopsichium pennsylvanicum TaxID=63383 RepID=A0AAJ4XP77_9BASI|nr:uncharacterized protein MEPE_04546 [Melanopsichium pennsylvanicum]
MHRFDLDGIALVLLLLLLLLLVGAADAVIRSQLTCGKFLLPEKIMQAPSPCGRCFDLIPLSLASAEPRNKRIEREVRFWPGDKREAQSSRPHSTLRRVGCPQPCIETLSESTECASSINSELVYGSGVERERAMLL